ncbi:MAG: TIGR00730 family Rossman fold protein [Pseudomonadota bacterium]
MSRPTSICVFCGSREGANPAYMAHATALGRALAGENWRLVYGAGDVGLMGAVARAAKDAGGDTFGVIPVHLMAREVAKRDLGQFIVTENMHERKKVMYMNSDALAVLPGGAGTLDEFFEVLTWRQLMLHAKPIYLLNTDGYWDPLAALIDQVIDKGFADASLRGFFDLADSVEEMVTGLRSSLA